MARTKVIETEEFAEAVAAKATEIAEKLIAERLQGLVTAAAAPAGTVAAPAAGGGAADVLSEVFSRLGMDMAAIANQGQRQRPLAPDELKRRETAEKRMWDLIAAAQKANDPDRVPTYKLSSKIYFNERFIEPFKVVDKKAVNNEITWTGVPNDAMIPINDAASEIFAAWRESTGGPRKLIPTADNRPLFVTAAGLTVRGDPPKRQQAVAAEHRFENDLGFNNNDPNAPEVAVLGTVAAKARQNAATGVNMAPRVGI